MEERGKEYSEKVRQAVIRAIMEQSGVDIGNGERACHIGVVQVCAVLTDIVAGFMASAPECRTPSGRRQVADKFRKGFLDRLKVHAEGEMRDVPVMGGTLN